jgi:hypothetical protein
MHCFHVSIVHFLWSLYITHINIFPTTIVSCISLFFMVPSETMDTGFTVHDCKVIQQGHTLHMKHMLCVETSNDTALHKTCGARNYWCKNATNS